jgi:short-subunit dehydrogenase
MPPLSNSVIVITGASTGLGRALALELARQRAKLVLAARDQKRLEQVAADCRRFGAETLVVPVDLAEREGCQRLIERTAEHFGRLDVLVNNAGRAMWARFDQLDNLAVMEDLMRVNYLGGVYCAYYALAPLKHARGLIVGMASASGLMGVPMLSGYAATKHAVIGFYDSLRVELAASGVDVTVVAPDFVQSRILARAVDAHGEPLDMSPLDQTRLMSAENCARRIVRGMARRKRLVLTSERTAWARWGRILTPWLVDRIAAASVGVRYR